MDEERRKIKGIGLCIYVLEKEEVVVVVAAVGNAVMAAAYHHDIYR